MREQLIGRVVKHKTMGVGTVIELQDTRIIVAIKGKEIKFQFPEAFESFLSIDDAEIQDDIHEMIFRKKASIEEEKKIKEQELASLLANKEKNIPEKRTNTSARTKKPKVYKKENVAFKCNYCDGGQDVNGIGYKNACTDDLIDYNINVAHHNWCCDPECPCTQYLNGEIDREELDAIAEEGGFTCYESQMLESWTAYAGTSLRDKEYRPLKLNNVQINSLAVLTTREPYAKEAERFVFAVFLVDDAYEGDNREAGYVTTSSKYKLSLSLEEAKKILFWNYYFNGNNPEKIAWGQGLHRFISDIQAASILFDIAELKKGTEDEKLALEFLEHFCFINNIPIEDLPIMEGGLMR